MSRPSHILVALLVAMAGPLAAQPAPDSTARTAPRAARDDTLPGSRPRLWIAGGIEARTVGSVGQLGVEWAQRGARPGLRVELSGHRDRESLVGSYVAFGCEAACTLRSSSTRLGLGLDAKYEFRRATVRPYVVSGLGLYRSRSRTTRNFVCAGTTTSPFVESCRFTGESRPFSAHASTDAALHAGVGLAVMLGRAQLFGELRRQTALEDYGAPTRGATPIVLGVRF